MCSGNQDFPNNNNIEEDIHHSQPTLRLWGSLVFILQGRRCCFLPGPADSPALEARGQGCSGVPGALPPTKGPDAGHGRRLQKDE